MDAPSTTDYIDKASVAQMIEAALVEERKRVANCQRPLVVFGMNSTRPYAAKVASALGVSLSPLMEKSFADGETYVKSERNVRGANVFVIQSLYSDDKESDRDKFFNLCMLCGSLRGASATEVIPVIPYLLCTRQDRKDQSRAPVATKYVAKMLEAVGITRVLLIDAHNQAAEQNAFDVPQDILDARRQFADWCAEKLIEEGRTKKIRVLIPDTGGLARNEVFSRVLTKSLKVRGVDADIQIVIFDKLRVDGKVKGSRIIGDVEDADVIGYDDMISTAGTMYKSSKAAIAAGGRMFAICGTHGFFCGDANAKLADLPNTHLVAADTINPFRLNEANRKRLHIVDTSSMVADAIKRIHSGTGSISELLEF